MRKHGWSRHGRSPCGATSFTAVRTFCDVEVVPFTELLLSAEREHRGGPIWPDWPDDAHLGYRHSSKDSRANRSPECPERYDEAGGANIFWIGVFCPHFGHQIHDLSSRIIGAHGARIPGGFWETKAWFGATR